MSIISQWISTFQCKTNLICFDILYVWFLSLLKLSQINISWKTTDFISARDFRWFTWTLTLIFSLLRSFILKITSPNNSEDHSFYKHFKRFAVRPLSDLKLPRSAGVLKSYLKLFKILKTAQLLSKFSNSLSKWAFKKLWMSKYSHCEYFQSTLSENHSGLVEHFSNHSGNRTYIRSQEC